MQLNKNKIFLLASFVIYTIDAQALFSDQFVLCNKQKTEIFRNVVEITSIDLEIFRDTPREIKVIRNIDSPNNNYKINNKSFQLKHDPDKSDPVSINYRFEDLSGQPYLYSLQAAPIIVLEFEKLSNVNLQYYLSNGGVPYSNSVNCELITIIDLREDYLRPEGSKLKLFKFDCLDFNFRNSPNTDFILKSINLFNLFSPELASFREKKLLLTKREGSGEKAAELGQQEQIERDRKVVEDQQRREQIERDRKVVEDQQRREQIERDRKAAEDQQRREQIERDRKVAEDQQRREQIERDRKVVEDQQRREQIERDRKVAEDQQRREQLERNRRAEEDRDARLQQHYHISNRSENSLGQGLSLSQAQRPLLSQEIENSYSSSESFDDISTDEVVPEPFSILTVGIGITTFIKKRKRASKK